MTNQQIEILEELGSRVFIIEDYMKTKKTYESFLEKIYDYVKAGFEEREFRTFPVKFKFRRDEDEPYVLELRHFLVNLMLWEPFRKLELIEEMDSSFIYDCTNITEDSLANYIDEKIIENAKITLENDDKGLSKIGRLPADVIYNLSRISTDFNLILGVSFDVYSFIKLAKENERFNEILNTKVDENLQPAEIEVILDNLMDEEVEILKKEDNCLRPMLSANVGIKHKQLREFSINGGTKPDLYGNTIPIPINSNFLINGLNNIENYTIDAMGGRKAAVMSKMKMGSAGHFATTVILLSSSIHFSHEEDCNTLFPIPVFIKNIKFLNKFVGRYYKKDPNDDHYELLKKSDMDVIGTIIYVRSPITCACKDGVCRTCYGKLYDVNKDLESPGGYSATKLMRPVSQDILSAKHLLTSNSTEIKFSSNFDKYCKLNANCVVVNDNLEDEIDDYTLIIKDEDLEMISLFDEGQFNHYVNKFYIRRKNEEPELIEEINENDLFLDKSVFVSMKHKNDHREINLSKVQSDTLFIIEIKNNELTKPLYEIMDLLDTKSANVDRSDLSAMVMAFNNLTIEARINLGSIHSEMILAALIRKRSNILERPDFSSYRGGRDYQFVTVKAALENNPSPIMGISFQYLKRQLTQRPSTYTKGGSSLYDALFKEY